MERKDFTLVEMLVVVGVIAVLAGLLLPALAHSRAAGLRTKCVNNHQQIIKAMGIYAGENDGQMIMRNHGSSKSSSKSYTYATVLSGIYEGDGDHDYRTKSYVPKEALVCPLSKEVLVTQHEKSSSRDSHLGENSIGILSPISNAHDRSSDVNDTSSSGWLYKSTKAHEHSSNNYHYYYQSMGYFVNVPDNEKKTVTFIVDRMKNPASLVIFADTFRKGGKGSAVEDFETYWAFNPRESIESNYYVTLAHQDTCSASLADGHVESMNPGRLRDCGTEIIKFLGSDLKEHPSSD